MVGRDSVIIMETPLLGLILLSLYIKDLPDTWPAIGQMYAEDIAATVQVLPEEWLTKLN